MLNNNVPSMPSSPISTSKSPSNPSVADDFLSASICSPKASSPFYSETERELKDHIGAEHDISFDQNHNEDKISRGSFNLNPSNVTLQTDSASNSEPLLSPESGI